MGELITRDIYSNAFFDACDNSDLVGVAVKNTYNMLLDFIGAEPTTNREERIKAITYMSTAGTAAGTVAIPWQDDPCAPAIGTEWGACTIAYNGFGRLRVQTESRDLTDAGLRKCENQPIYTWEGKPITSEVQWDITVAAKTLINQFYRALVLGDRTGNDYQFDGLRRLVRMGYVDADTGTPCTSMDANVINYNSNLPCPPTGVVTSGITWNGVAVPDGTNLYQLLDEAARVTIARCEMSTYGSITTGNMVLLVPRAWINQILDCYVCHKHCSDSEGLNSKDALAMKESIKKGGFGQGVIQLAGLDVPIIAYDSELVNAAGTLAEMYLLVNKIGNQPIMRYYYSDYRVIANNFSPVGNAPAQVFPLDQGKLLAIPNPLQGTCASWLLEMRGRLVIRAPWAQTRIINVGRLTTSPIFSSDPTHPLYVEQNLPGTLATGSDAPAVLP